jgi:hypothetical protein
MCSASESSQLVDCEWNESAVAFGDCGDCVDLCRRCCCFSLAFSFMDAMCDLSAKNARVFKLIRRSSSPWGGVPLVMGGGVQQCRGVAAVLQRVGSFVLLVVRGGS